MSHIISVITGETFLTLGSNSYYRWTLLRLGPKLMLFQIGPLLRLGPNVRWDLYYTVLGSSYHTCAFYIAPNDLFRTLRVIHESKMTET